MWEMCAVSNLLIQSLFCMGSYWDVYFLIRIIIQHHLIILPNFTFCHWELPPGLLWCIPHHCGVLWFVCFILWHHKKFSHILTSYWSFTDNLFSKASRLLLLETAIWVLGIFFTIMASFLLGPLSSLTGKYIHIKDQRYFHVLSLITVLSSTWAHAGVSLKPSPQGHR